MSDNTMGAEMVLAYLVPILLTGTSFSDAGSQHITIASRHVPASV